MSLRPASPDATDLLKKRLRAFSPLPGAEVLLAGEVRARGNVLIYDNLTCDFVAVGVYSLTDRTAEGCALLVEGDPEPFPIVSIRHHPEGHFALVIGSK